MNTPMKINKMDVEIRVRYSEVDQMGALHHSRYWVYFEIGRTEMLRAQGFSYADLEKENVLFVVASCEAKFKQPARYDDVLILKTEITKAGAARLDHTYNLYRKSDNALLCTATTTIACVDETGRITPIPENIKKMIPEQCFSRRKK